MRADEIVSSLRTYLPLVANSILSRFSSSHRLSERIMSWRDGLWAAHRIASCARASTRPLRERATPVLLGVALPLRPHQPAAKERIYPRFLHFLMPKRAAHSLWTETLLCTR